MNVALDVDGTIDSFPRQFQSLMSALAAAGHHVIIITGVSGDEVTQDDVDAKKTYLAELGVTMYTDLVVCPNPHDENKADAMEKYKVDLLIDNDKANVKAAAKAGVASLLLWNSKQ